ncbi:MAG: PTS sugar transporter subunit IIA [Phycisphaerales bacterium]|nr:PTS sugar transporter subunit IIA [Phycisphaerales bacterium]
MNLLDILKLECIKVPLDHAEKKAVIDEMVDLLAAANTISSPAALKEAVWSREQTRTTGIGQGLAIPHGKSDVCDDLMLAIGKPALPIDFHSIDRQPVRLVVLLVSPPDQTSRHIQALARISRLMTQDDFREAVYNANSAEEIYRLFEQYETSAAQM